MPTFPTENIKPTEPGIISTIVQGVIDTQKRNYVPGTVATRDVHTKSHGTYTAIFRVLDNLPKSMRRGLFASAAAYPATVRLSNGAPGKGADIKPNVRGFALEVGRVPGEKLLLGDEASDKVNFLLANHPTSFHEFLEHYPVIQELLSKGNLLGLLKQYPHEGRMLLRAVFKFIKNPLHITYFSQTPYMLGDDMAVKYVMIPASKGCFFSFPNIFKADYLRLAAQKVLRRAPAKFWLCVQALTAVDSIEDPSIAWVGPMIPVAELTINQITGSVPESAGEGLSFNPWRTLLAHKPLGWVNRVRQAVYRADFEWRSLINAALRKAKS
jgi:hypothetical protein